MNYSDGPCSPRRTGAELALGDALHINFLSGALSLFLYILYSPRAMPNQGYFCLQAEHRHGQTTRETSRRDQTGVGRFLAGQSAVLDSDRDVLSSNNRSNKQQQFLLHPPFYPPPPVTRWSLKAKKTKSWHSSHPARRMEGNQRQFDGKESGPRKAVHESKKKTSLSTPLPSGVRPLCDIPSGCCSFTGPWTVNRSSLRMLRRVAAFCRPLRPVLLLVSFPHSRSPVVGVPGLC